MGNYLITFKNENGNLCGIRAYSKALMLEIYLGMLHHRKLDDIGISYSKNISVLSVLKCLKNGKQLDITESINKFIRG